MNNIAYGLLSLSKAPREVRTFLFLVTLSWLSCIKGISMHNVIKSQGILGISQMTFLRNTCKN